MRRINPGVPIYPVDDPRKAYDFTKRVVIAGGAGFLGRALARYFVKQGWSVVILSRRAAREDVLIRTVVWDGRTVGEWKAELEIADAVVNLTGRSVACLYTPENKREILASRVDSVRAIAQAWAKCTTRPPVIVQASSLAFYGDAGDRVCDEYSPPGTGFSVEVCQAWENAFFEQDNGPREVVLRIGFVLGRNGGALEPLAKLARRFVGGAAGNGRQYISWLHINDFCAMVLWVINNQNARTIYNACTPNPVTNAAFMRALRKALGRPWSPPTPAWAVKLGARHIMKADPSLALTGRRCVPRKSLEEGFVMKHTDLDATLRELVKQ